MLSFSDWCSEVVILAIGLGAVGQRHVRNLRSLLGPNVEIIAYRTRRVGRVLADERPGRDVEQAYGIRVYTDLDDALSQTPDAVLVCNPTSLHIPVALAAARAGCHLFIEKPVSHTRDDLDELQRIVRNNGLKALVGFQFRFHPGLIAVRQLIQERAVGSIIHAHAHWGEYLPSWHPWEDYRGSYSACRALGGGVVLTLSHPLDYLRWMLGEVRTVSACLGCLGGLGIDVEDTADITLQFDSGAIGTVHLDYLQQPAAHQLRVTGTSGTILWDNETGAAKCYRSDRRKWQIIPPPPAFERNTLFLSEAEHFLNCVAGRAEPIVTLEDGVRTLEVALAAKRSAAEAHIIEM